MKHEFCREVTIKLILLLRIHAYYRFNLQAYVLHTNGGLMDLVDPKLCSDDLNMDEVDKVIRVALLCTSRSPALRPTMSQVVSILEGDISVHEFNLDPTTRETAEAYSYETEDVHHDSTESQAAR